MGTKEKILKQLNKFRDSKTLIVGIGNTLKGDDAVGPLICQQLTGKTSANLIDVGTVPENFIQPIIKKAPQNLLIIDAIDFSAPPGTTKIFKPKQLNKTAFSTHTLSPLLLLDVVCRSIKVDVYFIGIQPAQTKLGQSQSPHVTHAIQWLTKILSDIFPLKE